MNVGVWIRAARLKFLPQGVLPVALGTAVAFHRTGLFDPLYFFLAFVGAALIQVGLTILNDAHDYHAGTDQSATGEKNPYSGGSGVFVDGVLTVREALRGVAAMYLVAVAIGFYLVWKTGLGLLGIGLTGVAISVLYSIPPFRLAYRGLGEVAMLAGYGPVITAGAHFVQTSTVTAESVLVGLVPGTLMFCMIILNEIPDREEDLAAGKMNLVARVGPRTGLSVFLAATILLYGGIAAGVLLDTFPLYSLVALLTAPVTFRAYLVARNRLGRSGFERANRLMVVSYSGTVLLLTAAYLVA